MGGGGGWNSRALDVSQKPKKCGLEKPGRVENFIKYAIIIAMDKFHNLFQL